MISGLIICIVIGIALVTLAYAIVFGLFTDPT